VRHQQGAVGGGAPRQTALLDVRWRAVVAVRRVRLHLSTLACGRGHAQCSTLAHGCGLVPHQKKEKTRMRNGCKNRIARQAFMNTYGPSAVDNRDNLPVVRSFLPAVASVTRYLRC